MLVMTTALFSVSALAEASESASAPVFDLEQGTVLLNSGYTMPIMGLGTYSLTDEECYNSVTALLEAGDWSEHCTKTELGGRLEREITRLISDAQNDLSPEHLPCDVVLVPGMRIHEGVRTKTLLTALQRRAELSSRIKLMPSKIFDVVKFTPSQHTERDK